MEGNLHEFAHQFAPLDPPLARREMLVRVAFIVMNMKHSEIRA